MDVKVTLLIDVDWCDEDLGPVGKGDPLANRIEESVAEAITNAVKRAENNGHSHDMEDIISCQMYDCVAELV